MAKWTSDLESQAEVAIKAAKQKQNVSFSKDEDKNILKKLKMLFEREENPEFTMEEAALEMMATDKQDRYDSSLAAANTEEQEAIEAPEGSLAEAEAPEEASYERRLDYAPDPKDNDYAPASEGRGDDYQIAVPEEGENMGGDNDAGDRIRTVQKVLVDEGFDIGPDGVDGYYGPNTESAVKQYQEKLGLEPTGVIDAELFGKITG